MKYILLAFALVFLASPLVAQDASINDTQMATPTCMTYPEWTGKKVDEIDLTILGDRPYRVLTPDSMMTMDYSPDRLNIQTDADGIIITTDCG